MPVVSPPLRRYRELDGKTFLIGVGAMRSATTWVYWYLRGHPEAAVSPLKELHFFNAKFPRLSLQPMEAYSMRRLAFHVAQEGDPAENLRTRPAYQASLERAKMVYDDNAYFDHFARLVDPTVRIFADITPAYAVIGREGFAYMRAFAASQDVATRVLFVMRDPVARLWSQLRYVLNDAPGRDLVAEWETILADPSVLGRADYRGTVEALDAVFPAEEVMYLFYEDLLTEEGVRRLSQFAGIAPRRVDFARAHNAADVAMALPAEIRDALRVRLAPQYAFCRERFGAAVPAAWEG